MYRIMTLVNDTVFLLKRCRESRCYDFTSQEKKFLKYGNRG